jgi:hypothetical protein
MPCGVSTPGIIGKKNLVICADLDIAEQFQLFIGHAEFYADVMRRKE